MPATQTTAVLTDAYELEPAHTRLGFAVRYAMVTTVQGEFTQFSGHALLDGDDPTRSTVTVIVSTASISTRQSQRDEHLRSSDFLDVESYPEMIFRSTAVEQTGENIFRMTGDLTICGVTRVVPLDFTLTGTATDPDGQRIAGFKGSAVISRSDFGLTWNSVLETGGVLVGDDITLQLDVCAVKASDR